MMATLICAAVFPFLPAEGPVLHFGVKLTGHLADGNAVNAGAALHAFKDGYKVIDNGVKGGIVSLPSYHAASAVVIAWGAWSTPLRWPLFALNIVMALSAVVVGNHYLVDILAGMAVGAVALQLTSCLRRPVATGVTIITT